MAYVDTNRISPASIAAAVAMNALFLFGISTIGPVAGATDFEITQVTPYSEVEPTIKPQQIKKPIDRPIIKTPEVHVPQSPGFVTPLPPTDLTDGPGKIEIPLPPTPTFVEIIPPTPPMPPAPVLISARYDTRFASAQQPEYPSGMARQELEGFAKVNVRIGTDGRVKEVVNIASTRDEFFEATRGQALSKWRFKPATRDGVPVESWREMKVTFQMPKRFD